MTGKNLLSLAFRIVGLTFAVIAAVVAAVTLTFVIGSVASAGIVVDHASVQNQISVMPAGDQTGVLFYPVIEYTNATGSRAVFTGPRGQSTPRFQIGEEVPILVSQSGAVRLNTVLGVWGTPIILGCLAAIFLILGLAAPLGFGGIRQ